MANMDAEREREREREEERQTDRPREKISVLSVRLDEEGNDVFI